MALGVHHGVVLTSPEILDGRRIPAVIKAVQQETLTLQVQEPAMIVETAADLTVHFGDASSMYHFETKAVTAKPAGTDTFNIMRPTMISRAFKRSFERVSIEIPVEIGEMDRRDLVKARGKILDISGGGVLLQAAPGRNPGDVLKLTFELPGAERMEEVSGLVMWKKPVDAMTSQYGVEFNILSEIRRSKITAFVTAESGRKK